MSSHWNSCVHSFFFSPLIFRWMALMVAMVLLWDPKPPYGSLTSGPPCVWSAPPSSPKRGGDITAVRAERWGIRCTTCLLSRMREGWKGERKSETCALFFHQIACQACSSNEFPLEYKKNKLTRVCDQCFQVLLEQKGEQTQPLGKRTAFTFHKKQKLIPAALKEVDQMSPSSVYTFHYNSKKVGTLCKM